MANDNNLAEAMSNGNGTALKINRSTSGNREGSVFIYGTFNSATVKLQVNPKQETEVAEWFDISGANWVTKGVKELIFNAKEVRVVVTGGGGSESINAMLW